MKIGPLTSLLGGLFIMSLLAACGSTDNGSKIPSYDRSGQSGNSEREVTITLLTGNTQDTVNTAQALIEGFKKVRPHITIEMETSPGGSGGDNFVKKWLATGDMADVFFYNSGSTMKALSPEISMVDLTNEPYQSDIDDSYKSTVSVDGEIYGVPIGSMVAGGWFYNKKIYADLGLKIPRTWAELIANSEKIKAAGITPVIGTFKDAWTSQIVVLTDFYNVQNQVPNFADDYTAHRATNAGTSAMVRSFEKMQELSDKGFYNKDKIATSYEAGLKMLADGKGAQYPMLSYATPVIAQNFPEQIDNIGFFAQPSDDASVNGLTVWMPTSAYIYKESKHIEEAKEFLAYIASADGTKAVSEISKPVGPYVIKDAVMPDEVPSLIADMLPYFDSGKTAPALEFASPIKGPGLDQITVEVGSGIKSGKEGAAAYDKDVEKQAIQLGLAGW